MDNQKQIIERLKQANNVLVTVSTDPTVDQLAACLGLSLALNKLDKHAAAVYSGKTPSTIAFLEPDSTFEQTTDSLRDFIISLDKSKADKLRYKVEDDVVRIFITPYRVSISDKDLEFSQGDFNVDVVVALGVHEQHELDQAVTTHGRILHDATVITINDHQAAELGTINWLDESASSLSEMVTEIVTKLGDDTLDEQTSTALLTGIVSETDRFSNEKTSANTMKLSAALMAAGANQQLVATKLEEPVQPEPEPALEEQPDAASEAGDPQDDLSQVAVNDDGTLEISHPHEKTIEPTVPEASEPDELNLPPVSPDTQAANEVAEALLPPEQPLPEIKKDKRTLLPEHESDQNVVDSNDEDAYLGETQQTPPSAIQNTILSHDGPAETPAEPVAVPTPPEPPKDTQPTGELHISQQPTTSDHPPTLADLERQLASPHTEATESDELNLDDLSHPDGSGNTAASNGAIVQDASLDSARNAIEQAIAGSQSANSEPALTGVPTQMPPQTPTIPQPSAEQPVTMPLPPVFQPQQPPQPPVTQTNPNSPPPVPPPIMPPFNNGF